MPPRIVSVTIPLAASLLLLALTGDLIGCVSPALAVDPANHKYSLKIDPDPSFKPKHPKTPKSRKRSPHEEHLVKMRNMHKENRDAEDEKMEEDSIMDDFMQHAAPLEFCDELNLGNYAEKFDDMEIESEEKIREAIVERFGKMRAKGRHPDGELAVSEDECNHFFKTELTQKYKLDYSKIKNELRNVLKVIDKYYDSEKRETETQEQYNKRIRRSSGDLQQLHNMFTYYITRAGRFEDVFKHADFSKHPIMDYAESVRKNIDTCTYLLGDFTREGITHAHIGLNHELGHALRRTCVFNHKYESLTM